MDALQDAISKFVVLWAVIDPIGTVPVFISATAERTTAERQRIALFSVVGCRRDLAFLHRCG